MEAKDDMTSLEAEEVLLTKFGIKVDLNILVEKGYFQGTREEMSKVRISL